MFVSLNFKIAYVITTIIFQSNQAKFSQKDWIQSWPGLKPVGHEYHSPCPVCAAKTAFLFVQTALLPAGKTIVIIRTF